MSDWILSQIGCARMFTVASKTCLYMFLPLVRTKHMPQEVSSIWGELAYFLMTSSGDLVILSTHFLESEAGNRRMRDYFALSGDV